MHSLDWGYIISQHCRKQCFLFLSRPSRASKRQTKALPLKVRQAAGWYIMKTQHRVFLRTLLSCYVKTFRVSGEFQTRWKWVGALRALLVKQGSTSRIYCFVVVKIGGIMLHFSATRWKNKKQNRNVRTLETPLPFNFEQLLACITHKLGEQGWNSVFLRAISVNWFLDPSSPLLFSSYFSMK